MQNNIYQICHLNLPGNNKKTNKGVIGAMNIIKLLQLSYCIILLQYFIILNTFS